jgi:predicted nuclease of predicted toxin-antitoxin system
MRFKTDENLHPEVANLLRQHGHDVSTVWDQRMQGKGDSQIADAIRKENRALITLDKDFADIRNYPPSQFAGLIVCRLELQNRGNVLAVFQHVLRWLELHPLEGRLWIVEESDLRIRGDSA